MNCVKCGEVINEGSMFCSKCGTKVGGDINTQSNYAQNNMYVQTPLTNVPITPLGYIGYSILFLLPFLGLILAIVFALSSNNINVKNYAKSYIIGIIIAIIIMFILSICFGISILSFLGRQRY